MTEQLLAIAASYGPAGLLILYFVWREEKRDKREEERDKREERRIERIEQILQDNAEADKETAKALTLLTERVAHVRAL